jgi:hypothetical protein
MNIGKQVLAQLRLLAKEGPEAVGLQVLEHEHNTSQLLLQDADQSVRLELFDYDRYSVTLHMLEVGTPALAAVADTQSVLSAYAAEVARELSYLEEPLAVWELESREQVAQLRSFPPLREDEEISYWEVTLTAGTEGTERSARIMRYRWAPGMAEREVVAYPATFALIARMTDSLSSALAAVAGPGRIS